MQRNRPPTPRSRRCPFFLPVLPHMERSSRCTAPAHNAHTNHLSLETALETKGKKKKKPPAVRRLVGSTFGPAIAQAGVDVMVLVTRCVGWIWVDDSLLCRFAVMQCTERALSFAVGHMYTYHTLLLHPHYSSLTLRTTLPSPTTTTTAPSAPPAPRWPSPSSSWARPCRPNSASDSAGSTPS